MEPWAKFLVCCLESVGITGAIPEYRFHGKRRWRFDLAWPSRVGKGGTAFEREGGVWTGGRHVRGKGFEGDIEKYNEAALAGWTVIRGTPAMIEDGRAYGWLLEALVRRGMARQGPAGLGAAGPG